MLNKINSLIFRIITKVPRTFYSLFKLRPDSYPYISGDGFRKMADHIYDETKKCHASDITDGQIIFLNTDLIQEWFINIHPKITAKYKLITHNSDRNIGEKETTYVDNKIVRWFAQNVIVNHPKITPIPIGLENKRLFYNSIPSLIARTIRTKVERRDKILLGVNINTNPKERQAAFDSLIKNKSVEKIDGFPTPNIYIKILNQYKFVASPPGNGTDCHRTWVALYLGVIPVVKESVGMTYFKNLGLPIYIVPNYDNVDILKYQQINSNTEALEMNYWINKIKNEA